MDGFEPMSWANPVRAKWANGVFQADFRDAVRLTTKLQILNRQGIPFATRHALNAWAIEGRGRAQDNIKSSMILRNRWTLGSVRFAFADRGPVASQASRVGATTAYLSRQESGGTERATGAHGLPIPSAYASGEDGATQRRKLVKRRFSVARIQFNTPARVRSIRNRKRRAFVSVQHARRHKQKFVFLDLGRSKGIFRVTQRRIRMVHDVSRKTVTTPRNPWLEPINAHAPSSITRHYVKALRFQLRRR